MSLDVLITLVPLAIFSAVYYGFRPVLLILIGIGTAVVCETLCCLLMRRRPSVLDGTAAVTGGLIGALLAVPLTAAIKVLYKRYIWQNASMRPMTEPLPPPEEPH